MKTHMTSGLVFARGHVEEFETKRQKLLWSDETKAEFCGHHPQGFV